MGCEYAQFDERTAREMLDHIMAQVKQKLTSNDRSKMRAEINADWDQTQDIRVYLKNMERSKVYLAKWGIIISDQEMTSDQCRPKANQQLQPLHISAQAHLG